MDHPYLLRSSIRSTRWLLFLFSSERHQLDVIRHFTTQIDEDSSEALFWQMTEAQIVSSSLSKPSIQHSMFVWTQPIRSTYPDPTGMYGIYQFHFLLGQMKGQQNKTEKHVDKRVHMFAILRYMMYCTIPASANIPLNIWRSFCILLQQWLPGSISWLGRLGRDTKCETLVILWLSWSLNL